MFLSKIATVAFQCLLLVHATSQAFFDTNAARLKLAPNSFPNLQVNTAAWRPDSTYDQGLFTPLESLSALSDSQFTTFGHPFFPAYNVRIKKTRFCDGTVKCVYYIWPIPFLQLHCSSYTGYIDIEARHLFFYFFESRSNPDKDDVIFWTNGGTTPTLCLKTLR